MKFEDSLANKIEMKKVKLDVMKPWISDRVSTLLGMYIYVQGRMTWGGGGGAPLESKIYVVNFLKIVKIWFFLLFGPPLSKNCSPAPDNYYICNQSYS